jgi:hypothetical protein
MMRWKEQESGDWYGCSGELTVAIAAPQPEISLALPTVGAWRSKEVRCP